ncbi:MAG: penicillin-binding protein 2 [Elusimicrobia bacterium]|nr:penicillin-binding protein 2 [Elusimicrobiota bacterium]
MTKVAEKAAWLRLIVLGLLGVFTARLFLMQVIFGNHYRILAERNRFQIFYRQAPRGAIMDRNGFPLASNIGVFNMYFNPRVLVDEPQKRIRRVGSILHLNAENLNTEILLTRKAGRTRLVARQIAPEHAFRFLEQQNSFPEFFLASESLRHYPLGRAFSHVLGYLTRIQSRDEYERLKERGYRFDSWVGGFGLEKKYEDFLRGSDGAVLFEVDAKGRPLATSPPAFMSTGSGSHLEEDPYPGGDLMLTADYRLIQAAHDALEKSSSGKGSVVAVDPRTGGVLALVSTPGFDPNAYIRLDTEESAPSRTEFLRALTGLYPPGSVFKPVTAIAALEKGLDPLRRYRCNGAFALPTRVFRCWKEEGHGSCDFIEGIKNSCDVYFYNAGLFAGGEAISSWALKFSLGKAVALIEFPEWSKEGFVPTPKWKEIKKHDAWYPGDTLNLSIGQGETLVTPMQIAALFSMLANHGQWLKPHVLESMRYPETGQLAWKYDDEAALLWSVDSIKDQNWRLVEEGLRQVIEFGTGRPAMIPGYHIYGKTGTAQNPHGEDHALFACYLKDDRGVPRIAVSVVIDNGGKGSSAAAPVAKKVLEEFIKITPDLISTAGLAG